MSKKFVVTLNTASSEKPRWNTCVCFNGNEEKLQHEWAKLDFDEVVYCGGVTLILEMENPLAAPRLRDMLWNEIIQHADITENGERVDRVFGGIHAIGRDLTLSNGPSGKNFLLGESKVAIPIPFDLNGECNQIALKKDQSYEFRVSLAGLDRNLGINAIKMQLHCTIGQVSCRRVSHFAGTEVFDYTGQNTFSIILYVPRAKGKFDVRFIYFVIQHKCIGDLETFTDPVNANLVIKTPTGEMIVPMVRNEESWSLALDCHENNHAAMQLAMLPAYVALLDRYSSVLFQEAGEAKIVVTIPSSSTSWLSEKSVFYATPTIVFDEILYAAPSAPVVTTTEPTLETHEQRIKELERKLMIIQIMK